MNADNVLDITRQALMIGAKVGLPILLAVLAVGLLFGIIQSVTQLQEPTLPFVPKLLAVAAVLLLAGGWMLDQLVSFTRMIITSAPNLLG